MIGQTISHYKILEKLGEGGMGVVYKAHDTKLDRVVALKFLPHYLTSDAREKERFYHEARAASALNHPNITTIYEIDEHDNQLYLAMEYVEGKTLKKTMEEGTPSIKKILEIAIQACEGLAVAAEKGVVHRDIKSDNIMVSAKGQVKIMDFGLAKLKGASKITKTGSTLGTAAYMSPEQAQGEEVDHRSDIFSFGVVLYEILTGKLPFRGEHHAALVYSIMNEEPQPLARFNNNVSQELERIVAKALAKDKEERYQHIDELLADLRRERKQLEYVRTDTAKTSASAASIERPQPKTVGLKYGLPAGIVIVIAILIWIVKPFHQDVNNEKSNQIDHRAVAVLPFENLSDDKQDEYFSDGITEDIITQLAKISGLNVVSRTSVMRYKGTKKGLKEIAEELGASVILEGTVRRIGNRVRIVGQLVDAGTDKHLWAETYDRELRDIFGIQTEVAQQIAHALQTQLSPTERENLHRRPTQNLDAYTLYLQGRYYWRKRTAEDLQRAADYLNQAVRQDPSYALAYVGLADCYALFPYYEVPALSGNEAFSRAEQMVKKALEIDSTLAEAHSARGNILKEWKWDWKGAEREFQKAIALNPKYATAHQWYSENLMVMGRLDEAVSEARKAVELEPASPIIVNNLGIQLLYVQQYDEAERVLKKANELEPNLRLPIFNLTWLYAYTGRYREFSLALEKTTFPSNLIRVLKKGLLEKNELRAATIELDNIALGNTRIDAWVFAEFYAILHEKEKALAWLVRSAERRDPELPNAIRRHFLAKYRSDPQYQMVLKMMGVQENQ